PNDTDPNHDPVTVTTFIQPSHGSVVINPDGTVTYTPNAGFTGASDFFAYRVTDGTAVSLPATVAIGFADDTPVAVGQTVFVNEDTLIPIPILLTGTDRETPPVLLGYKITRQPSHGTLVFGALAAGGKFA